MPPHITVHTDYYKGFLITSNFEVKENETSYANCDSLSDARETIDQIIERRELKCQIM